jgi:hypothetical protein
MTSAVSAIRRLYKATKHIWDTSDLQERLDDNRESPVTLERQLTTRKV